MKKHLLYTAMAFSFMTGFSSCSDFGDVNNDPEQMTPEVMDYRMMLTHVMTQACGSDWDIWRNGCIYSANMMQHTASFDWSEGTFYTYTDGYSAAYWDAMYCGNRATIRDLYLIMKEWKDNPEYANEYQICRIMRSYIFQRMTDLYGDVPYFEAGQGSEGLGYPKYDTQEAIYTDLLKELTEARDLLDPAKGDQMGARDVVFGGNIERWQKFANSLLLRVAMRLTKVAPTVAEQYVENAAQHHDLFITDIADNAMVIHPDGTNTDDSAEPYGKIFSGSDPQAFFLSEFFIDLLKDDPRLALVATVCENPKAAWGDEAFDFGDCTPEKQKGLPIGYETGAGEWSMTKIPGFPVDNWRSVYSVPNRYTYARPDAPTMFVTAAETQLLLAEAALRGWVTNKTPEQYYEAGIRAAMEQFLLYSAAENLYKQYLTSEAVNEYVAANPLGNGNEAYKNINIQYYITTFCDEYETFANWRRSGYPELTPVNKGYPSCETNGNIPRRFRFPLSESINNAANYKETVERMGGDTFMTRVWWDKE